MTTPTKTSATGLAKITGYEGKLKKLGDGRYIAYRCPANVPTIYIGCTYGVHDGMIITEEQGQEMFARELEKKEAAVLRLVTVPLNQNEFDALVSFTYNCGEGALAGSTLLKRLNKGDRIGAAKAFAPWNKATVNGKKVVLKGLVQRRASEANLFMKPVEEPSEPYMPQTVQKSAEPPSHKVTATAAAAATVTAQSFVSGNVPTVSDLSKIVSTGQQVRGLTEQAGDLGHWLAHSSLAPVIILAILGALYWIWKDVGIGTSSKGGASDNSAQ